MSDREELEALKGLMRQSVEIARQEIDWCRARIAELEAEIMLLRGTRSAPEAPADDQPTIIHDVAPNAPR